MQGNVEFNEQTATESVVCEGKKKNYSGMARILCLCAILFGTIESALRSLILFGEYSNDIALYPRNTTTLVFAVSAILFTAVLLCFGLLFNSKDKDAWYVCESGASMFFGSLVGFCFLAFAITVMLAAKVNGTSLGTIDGVMIVLCLICAVSYIAGGLGMEKTLGSDAAAIMMLSRPIACLFIAFYFYFDQTTVIHNSNKKAATIFFVAALLTLLYSQRKNVGKPVSALYISFALCTVCHSLMYSVPNLIWYAKVGEPLLVNVFIDVISLVLGLLSAVYLMNVRSGGEECEPISDGEEGDTDSTDCSDDSDADGSDAVVDGTDGETDDAAATSESDTADDGVRAPNGVSEDGE